MSDLDARGLLDTTTIIWMGEFGRTPQINRQGRDHFPVAWSTVLAGGGMAGGQAYGRTTADGMDSPKSGRGDRRAGDLCTALGVPPETENTSNTGRPIKIVDGTPIEILSLSECILAKWQTGATTSTRPGDGGRIDFCAGVGDGVVRRWGSSRSRGRPDRGNR